MPLTSVFDYCRVLCILKKYLFFFWVTCILTLLNPKEKISRKPLVLDKESDCPPSQHYKMLSELLLWDNERSEVLAKQSSGALPFRLCLCKDLVGVVAGAGLGGGGQAAGGGGDHGHGLGRVLRGIGRGALREHCH